MVVITLEIFLYPSIELFLNYLLETRLEGFSPDPSPSSLSSLLLLLDSFILWLPLSALLFSGLLSSFLLIVSLVLSSKRSSAWFVVSLLV
jgi:hypothetical protein